MLSSVLLFFTFLFTSQAVPVPARTVTDFYKVKADLERQWSGLSGDPADKYFHESVFDPHYDGRFASDVLPDGERHRHLVSLLQSYFSTMNDIGAETWIMHGSLLGWWWNRKIMPWDSDIDVQMSEQSLHTLAQYHNMTLHHYKYRDGRPGGKEYLLEVNPHYKNGSTDDYLNVIDARWIDTQTGLFIDLTAVRKDKEAEARGYKVLMCKDKHQFLEKEIYPLHHTTLEGVNVRIPNKYRKLLVEEYSERALKNNQYKGYQFDTRSRAWIPNPFSNWWINADGQRMKRPLLNF